MRHRRWVHVSDDEECAANGQAESPTFGFEFEADFWHRHPEEDQSPLRELMKRRAISEVVLTGGEWWVDDTIQRRLLSAAELVYTTTIAYTRGEREPERIAGCISVVKLAGKMVGR